MKAKEYTCLHCDAVFKIKTFLDEDMYTVYYCPYCGGEIDEPDVVEEDEDSEEEDE